MIFTEELLSKIEKQAEIKKSYAAEGSVGNNKMMALPLVVIALSAFAAYYFYGMVKTDETYRTYFMVAIAVIVICIIVLILMQRSTVAKTMASLNKVPVCLGKQVYGNEQSETYYCIYTTGDQRYDGDFIEAVADKIINVYEEPNEEIRKKITRLFEPSFTGDKLIAELLPVEFTFGEKVYRKEIKFRHLNLEMKNEIAENNGKCILFVFGTGGVALLKELPD